MHSQTFDHMQSWKWREELSGEVKKKIESDAICRQKRRFKESGRTADLNEVERIFGV